VAWPPASRAGRSRPGWDELRRRCRGSWPETAAAAAIGPRPPTPRRSAVPSGPRQLSWRSSRGCGRWWRPSWPCGGHRSRSPGWLPLAYPQGPVMRVSHETIYLSLFVQGRGRCAASCSAVCARVGRCAIREPSGCPRAAASCATPSISASDPPRRPTGRCPALGRRPGVRPPAQRGRDAGGAP
jgi:hypothetical protein